MIRLFSQIIDEVLTQMGKTTDSVDSTVLESIKLRINEIQDSIFFSNNFEWRKERFYFSSRSPVETGTVTVTKGSRSVTGSGTSFTDIIKFGYLKVDNRVYKIDPHTAVTSTTFNIAADYPETTQSGATYQIVFPDYIVDSDISAIVNIFNDGEELDVKNSNRLILDSQGTGRPKEAAIIGKTNFDFYAVGDVTVTNGSTTVTGSGTTFTSDMIGMPFRVDETPINYTIQAVNSATELVLRDPYQGDTGSGKTYKIAPRGSLLLQLRSVPDDVYFFEIEALARPRTLVGNNEVSRIPSHAPLIHGAIWLALHEQDNENVTRVELARRVYERSLKELKEQSKIVTNVKWQNEDEAIFRRQGIVRFNPLDPRRFS